MRATIRGAPLGCRQTCVFHFRKKRKARRVLILIYFFLLRLVKFFTSSHVLHIRDTRHFTALLSMPMLP